MKSFGGGSVATVFTDWNGHFQVDGLPFGTSIVVVEEPDYEPIHETVELSVGFQPGLLLYLKKRINSAGPSQPGYVVSVRELSIPAKARREFQRGLERLARKDPAGSLTHFKQAAAAFSNYFEAYYQMGVADVKLQRTQEAEQVFRKSIELSGGGYIEPQLALAQLLCQREDFAEAEVISRQALELDATSWAAHYLLGLALLGLNHLDEAEKQASAVVLRKPDFARAYLLLANLHIRRREYLTALKDLNDFLKLEPSGPLSEQARQTREAIERTLLKSGTTVAAARAEP